MLCMIRIYKSLQKIVPFGVSRILLAALQKILLLNTSVRTCTGKTHELTTAMRGCRARVYPA